MTGAADIAARPWTTAAVRDAVVGIVGRLTDPADAASHVVAVCNAHGYDSVDRELGFAMAAELHGWDYDEIYRAWLRQTARVVVVEPVGPGGDLDLFNRADPGCEPCGGLGRARHPSGREAPCPCTGG